MRFLVELPVSDLSDLLVYVDQVFPHILQPFLEAFHLPVRLNELHELLLAESANFVLCVSYLYFVLLLQFVERADLVRPNRL